MRRVKKKIISGFLAAMMVVGTITEFPIQSVEADDVNHLIINQIYGGGGKGKTPVTNSFIELYNPTSKSVSLSGYSIVCGTERLDLSAEASIGANSSYFVKCNPESTTDDLIAIDLPQADQEWTYTIGNKDYIIDLLSGETIVDEAVATQEVINLKISKQKSLRRIDYRDTDSNDDWQIVIWEKSSVNVTQEYLEQYAPRNSKGELGNIHKTEEAPTYTAVETSDNKVYGVNNGKGSLDMELFARYNSGAVSSDGGSLEIVEYNNMNGYAYAVSGLKGKVTAVKVSDVKNGEKVVDLQGTEYDVKDLIAEKAAVEGFVYGDTTSVAISPDGTKLAAAIQHAEYDKAGIVAIFQCNEDGTLVNPKIIATGIQPDMVVFADNNTVLTADEGEPRNGYADGTVDPKGTVSIINITDDTSVQAGFDNFTAEALTEKNIILSVVNGEIISPETDLEPEYIAVSDNGKKAYVSLQEANAIAVLDIKAKKFTGIYSVGFEDYSKIAVDILEDNKYEARTYENLVGARMPDGISIYEDSGKTYVITANEGDAKEWGDYLNEAKTKEFTGKNIRVLNDSLCSGLPKGKSVMFGGRGFTILEVTNDGLKEVFDSGSDFEKISAEAFPKYFNCSNNDNKVDSRSPKKGPEPENITIGYVNGRTYAFAALERIGGIIVYDITSPQKSTYVNYLNSREFENEIQGDVSPEGICFVSSNKAGNPMILAACEVSGTLAVYELKSSIKESITEPEPEQTTTIPEQTTIISSAHTTHVEDVRNIKAATYFKKGYTGDTYCKICGELLKKGTEIAKKTLKKPIIKVKAGKNKLTVSIKKVSGAKYYQIKIKHGKKWKTIKVSKLKKIIKKHNTGVKYQVKVRAVVTKGKRKAYSKYSDLHVK